MKTDKQNEVYGIEIAKSYYFKESKEVVGKRGRVWMGKEYCYIELNG